MLSFDRYSRDDVIGEVLLPVYEALEETTTTADLTCLLDKSDNGNHSSAVALVRDIAPRSHKVYLLPFSLFEIHVAAFALCFLSCEVAAGIE